MCGLLFLNINLEHSANKLAMWHLCWWEGQTKANQTLVFWNSLTIKTKQIKKKKTTIICTWTKRTKHSQFFSAKRRGQGETSGKAAEGWSLKRAGANRRAWWPGVDTNSTRWNENGGGMKRRLKKPSQDAVFWLHTPLNTPRLGLSDPAELDGGSSLCNRRWNTLRNQTTGRLESFFHKHNIVLDHIIPLNPPRKLSSSTKFQAKLDNFKRFPTHSIRQYSFHHPFLFPTGAGEGVIIYSLARQTRSHIAAAPLTELRTSNFGP